MKDEFVDLSYNSAEIIAKEYFVDSCGLSSNNKNHQEILTNGLRVLENCKSNIHLSALISHLDKGSFLNSKIIMSDKVFKCTAFEQIPDNNVIDVFAFLLTVGECRTDHKNLEDQYYADVWANAFLEGGRVLLRQQIAERAIKTHHKPYITYSFGPGFYGMNADRIKDLITVMNSESIGISLDAHGLISPSKTCGGFFLAVKDKEKLPPRECKDCIGNEVGCQYCGGKNRNPSRETCLKLLNMHGTPDHVIQHCKSVSEIALRIARALNKNGYELDLDLIEGAALLHDIARVEENHGLKGSMIVERHGYKKAAKLIKCHMFYVTDLKKEKLDEQDILCLADRMVKEDKYVGLEIRMQYVLDKFKGDQASTDKILQRLEENRIIRDRIEEIIGMKMDHLMD